MPRQSTSSRSAFIEQDLIGCEKPGTPTRAGIRGVHKNRIQPARGLGESTKVKKIVGRRGRRGAPVRLGFTSAIADMINI